MKHFLSLLFILTLSLNLVAQSNSELHIANVKVYDEGDGFGTIEIQVTGTGASGQLSAEASISGESVLGGSAQIGTGMNYVCPECPETNGNNGNTQILRVGFQLAPYYSDDLVDVYVNINGGAALIIGDKSRIKQRPRKYYRQVFFTETILNERVGLG